MELTQVAFLVGMIFGALMIGSVCVVYVKRSTFGTGGGMLSVLGVLLIGMSVWSTARFEVSPEGLKVEVDRLQKQVEEVQERAETISGEVQNAQERAEEVAGGVEQVQMATRRISEDLAEVALTAKTGNEQILRLSEALEERQTLDPRISREIQEPLRRVPQLDVERLRRTPDVVLEPPAGPPPGGR